MYQTLSYDLYSYSFILTSWPWELGIIASIIEKKNLFRKPNNLIKSMQEINSLVKFQLHVHCL